MKQKIIALNLNQINPAYVGNTLDLIVNEDEIIINVNPSADPNGIEISYELLEAIEKIDVTQKKKATVNITSNTNLQFISMYLVAPPGEHFLKRFGHNLAENEKPEIHFKLSPEAAVALMDATSSSDKYFMLLPEILYKQGVEMAIELKADTKPSGFPKEQVHTTEDSYNLLKALNENTKNALSLILNKYNKKWEEYNIGFANWLENFTASDLTPNDLSFIYQAKSNTNFKKNVPIKEINSFVEGLSNKQTFHVTSDQTTHMFIAGNDLILVDSGFPYTAEIINKVLKETPHINNVIINITHFHADHAGLELVRAINAAASNQKKVQLNVAEESSQQLYGWLGSNQQEILPLLERAPRLQIALKNNYDSLEKINDETFFILVQQPKSIEHFIPTNGLIITTKKQNKTRIFSADFNEGVFNPKTKAKYSKTEVMIGITEYLDDLFDKAIENTKPGGTVEFYIDIGHFLPTINGTMYDDYFKFLEKQYISMAANKEITDIKFFYDHNKSKTPKGEVV
jgi:hypothetical protein